MGSREGAHKSAAAKCGCTVEVWRQNRASGLCWCYRCEVWKDRSSFAADRSRSNGAQSLCKSCMSDATTASRYKMSRSDLVAFKASGCAICGKSKTVYVDHCHKTGRVREPLCPSCNSGIGLFNDDPELIRKAIAYLEKHDGRKD